MTSLRLYTATYVILLYILHYIVTAKDVYVDNTNAAADADSTNSMIGDGSAGSPYQTLVKALTAVTQNIINDPQNPGSIVGQLTEDITLILTKSGKVYALTTSFILSSTLDVTLELKSAVTPTIDWNANTTTADTCAGEIPTVTLTSPGRLVLTTINFKTSLLLYQFSYNTWGNTSPPIIVTGSTSLTIDQICYKDISNDSTDSPVAFFNAQSVATFTVSNIVMALNYFQPFISFLLCNSGSVDNIILHYGGTASTSTDKVLIITLTGQIVDSKIQDSTATNLLLADTYASVTGFTLFCDQTDTTCKTSQNGGGYISITSFGKCYLSNFYTENIYGSAFFTSLPSIQCNKVMSWKDIYINGYSYTGVVQTTTDNVQGITTAQTVSFEDIMINDFTGQLSFTTVYSSSTQFNYSNITIKDSTVSLVLLASGTTTLDFTSSSFTMDSLSITDSTISTTDTAVVCLTMATDGTSHPATATFSNIALSGTTFSGASLISSVGSVLTTGVGGSSTAFFLEVAMTKITSLTITDCSFVLESSLAELISFTNTQLYLKNLVMTGTTMQNYALVSFAAFGTAVVSNATLTSNTMESSSILKYPSVYTEDMSRMSMYTFGTTSFLDDATSDMKITPRRMVFITGVTSTSNTLTDGSTYFMVSHEIAVLIDSTFTSDTLEDTSSYIESTVISYKIASNMDATSTQPLLDLQTGVLQGLFTREDSRVTQFLNYTYVQTYTGVATEYNMILVNNCTFSSVLLSTGGVLNIAYLFPNSTVRITDNTISSCSGLDGIWLSIKVPNNDIQISGTKATTITNTAALISVLEDVYSYSALLADTPTIEIKDSSVGDASTATFLSIEMDLLDTITITEGSFTGNALAAHFISLRQGLRSTSNHHDLSVKLESLVFSDMNLTVEDNSLSINSLIFLETDTDDVGLSKGSISLNTVSFTSCSVTGDAESESFDHFVMIYGPAYDITLANLLLNSCQRVDTYPYVNITSQSIAATGLNFTSNLVPMPQVYDADTRPHSIMLISSDGHADITSSSFSSNYMDLDLRSDYRICPGGVLELEGNIDLTITNSTVYSNEVCQGLFISTDTLKSLVVSNCTFEENIVGANSGIVDIVTCTDCSFTDNTLITSNSLVNFFYWGGTDSSTVTTYTVNFISNTMYIAENAGLRLAELSGKQTNSALIIDDLKVEGAYDGSRRRLDTSLAVDAEAVLANGGTITIRNTALESKLLTGYFVELHDSQTLIFLWESSEVSDILSQSAFIYADLSNTGSTITLQDLTVSNVTFDSGSSFLQLFFYLNPNVITVKECSFSFVSSTIDGEGSVVHASSSFTDLSLYIMDTTFTDCMATRGGVLWAQNLGISTVNSTYSKNSALEAGSVFYFNNDSDAKVNVSTYIDNSIAIDGAGTNTASHDISALAVVFNDTEINEQNIVVTSLNDVLLYRNVTTYTFQKMTIALQFQDSKGNIYCKDKTKTITLTLTTSSGGKTYYSFPDCVDPCSCVLPSAYIPSITGTPFSEFYLTLTMSYVSDATTSTSVALSYSFYVIIRDCVRGEFRAGNGTQCFYCEAGTYSNNIDDGTCSSCPDGADSCLGGNKVSLSAGYWRSSLESDILECPDDGTCLGGLNSECGAGSVGPTCSQCREEEGWVKQTSGGCGKCSEQASGNAILGIVIIAILIYQSFFVHSTYKANKSCIEDARKEALGMYLRLFSYASSFTMMFSYVKNDLSPIFSKFSTVSNPYPTVFLSIDCILAQKGLYDIQLLGARMLIFLFWPIIKVLFVSLVLIVLKLAKKIDKISQFIVLTIGCIYLVEQPAIIDLLVGFFICTEFVPNSGQFYVDSYPNVECYTDEWNQILYVLVIPGIILWAVALPVSFYFGIRRGAGSIEEFYMRYGHFLQEFRPKVFYWGLIRMTNTTVLLIILNVLRSDNVRYPVLFLYTLFYYTILKKVNPYHINRAYQLEKIMIVVFGVSCLFILTLSETTQTSSRLILLLIAALINACGVAAVAKAAAIILIRDIKEKIAEFKEKRAAKKAAKEAKLAEKVQKEDMSIDAAKELLFTNLRLGPQKVSPTNSKHLDDLKAQHADKVGLIGNQSVDIDAPTPANNTNKYSPGNTKFLGSRKGGQADIIDLIGNQSVDVDPPPNPAKKRVRFASDDELDSSHRVNQMPL